MNFKDLVEFIEAQGCKVYLYKKKKKIDDAYAYFLENPKPHIKMALKGMSKKRKISTLLHEYGHFLQWRDGFSQFLDGLGWCHQIFEDWVEEYLELNKREIKMIRNAMLWVEYDADLRAINISKLLDLDDWDLDFHLKDSQSYMASIKWGWVHRKTWKTRPKWTNFPAKRLTHKKLFAPLTRKEKKIMKKIKLKKSQS